MALTLRNVKQSPLTHGEMDNNLTYLNNNSVQSASGNGNSTLTLTKQGGSTVTVDLLHSHVANQLPSDITVMSNYDTDDLSEGDNNKYFTNARVDTQVDSHLSGGTGIDYNAGTISVVDTAINSLYQPDGTNKFVYTDNAGALHIDGDIVQSGSAYEVNAETVTTTQELIVTRDGATTAISSSDLSGLEVTKYDGTNNLLFGTDLDGYFKVGESGELQILATRQDSPTDNGVPVWNDTEKRFDTSSDITWNGSVYYMNGELQVTGDITAYYSDERLKTFQGTIDSAVEKIKKINGYYFQANDLAESFGYVDKSIQVGVNAQELQRVLPEVVKLAPFDRDENNQSKSGENYLTVAYDKIVPLLIEAIKEQEIRISELEGKI